MQCDATQGNAMQCNIDTMQIIIGIFYYSARLKVIKFNEGTDSFWWQDYYIQHHICAVNNARDECVMVFVESVVRTR